jgi:hypothetical protein
MAVPLILRQKTLLMRLPQRHASKKSCCEEPQLSVVVLVVIGPSKGCLAYKHMTS